ncbi:sensor histidine kinase [Arenibacter arenosicollis]
MNFKPPCYIFSFSVDGNLAHINQLMLSHLEYDELEVIGRLRFEDLLTGGSRIFYKTHFLPMLLMQGKVDEMFLSLSSKSGKEYPVLMNMVLSGNSDTPTVDAVGLHMAKRNKYEKGILEAKQAAEKALKENDVLLKMKAELERHQELLEQQLRELKRINKEHVEFNKVLAHDMQEPLRKIQLFAGLLEGKTEKEGVGEEFGSYLKKLQGLSEYSRDLLMRLQHYHSLESRINNFTTGNLEEMIQAAISKLSIPEIQPDLTHLRVKDVRGDIPRLTWVLKELLANAYQFRTQGKPLYIEISSDLIKDNYYKTVQDAYRYTDFIQIRIKDNSQGFPINDQDKIFGLLQKFHVGSGTGLGLAYCKKIVDLHYGHILIKDIAGGGSQFTILLPYLS